jgi:hypothetical protein
MGPELLDRLLFAQPLAIKLPDPEVMLGIAAPEPWVAPQPAKRVALAHLSQRRDEVLVEEQKGKELATRVVPRTQHPGHHRVVNVAQCAEPSVALTERPLRQTSDFSGSLRGDKGIGNPSIRREPSREPVVPGGSDRSNVLILDEERVDSGNATEIIADLINKQTVEDVHGHIRDTRSPASRLRRRWGVSERLKADHDHLLCAKINGRFDWAVKPGPAIGVVASCRSRGGYLHGREEHGDRSGRANVLAI